MRVLQFIFLCMVFAQPYAKAQSIVKVTYSCLSRRVAENPHPFHHTAILEIGNDSSIYGDEITPLMLKYNQIPMDNVCKDFVKQKMLFRGSIGFEKVATSEDIPDFQWEMLEGDSVVCDYHCQKARTSFRGRTWVVWYSLDLPYSDGPWKLSGLPGLILKASDMKGDYSFCAYKIEKKQVAQSSFSTKGMAMMTPQKYHKILLDYYDERNHREHNLTVNGKSFTPHHETPCLMEIFDEKQE